MSTNASILIRENAHIGSFVGNDLTIKEVRQALYQIREHSNRVDINLRKSHQDFRRILLIHTRILILSTVKHQPNFV